MCLCCSLTGARRSLVQKQMPPAFLALMCSWQMGMSGSLVSGVCYKIVASIHQQGRIASSSLQQPSKRQHQACNWAAQEQTLLCGVFVCAGELEMRVFDTPGHTRGHVTYWLPEAKALFPGGLILREPALTHAHTALLQQLTTP